MYAHALVERFREEMRRQPWLPANEAIVAGISGGRDSMALGALLAALAGEFGWRITVGHVHHGLRGADTDADAALVSQWAGRWGFEFVLMPVRVEAGHGQSIEMAARQARRDVLLALAERLGARVVLAHHLEDQAETVLLRLLRGTGAGGLSAMRPVTGRVVRPLLGYSRADLTRFLQDMDIPWREDAMNEDPAMVRNRIRHQLLPLLAKDYNPRVVQALARLAKSSAELEEWAHREALRQYQDLRSIDPESGEIRLTDVIGRPRALVDRILRLAVAELGFSVTEEQLDRAHQGNTVWPLHHAVERQGRDLVIIPPFAPLAWPTLPTACPAPGRIPLPVGELMIQRGEVLWADRLSVAEDIQAFWVRGWKPGDRVALTGGGTKKLQDIFVDRKIARRIRHAWPVVTADAGGQKILTVPGLVTDVSARAQPGQIGWRVTWHRS